MRFAIVGCGLIGRKRTQALGVHSLVIAADVALERAKSVAALKPGATATEDWRAAATHPDADAVIVATTNDQLTPVAMAAVQAGKHVIVEKPAARNAEELRPLLMATERKGVIVKVGFNHRLHPALQKARAIVDGGEMGPLYFIRGRYGHGGRVGYEKEWRADPLVAGGGEMLDQGVHLIDLARWFLGDFPTVDGRIKTYFWDMPVEDNGFMMLETKAGQVAWLHVSCMEWKNMFSLEIYGQLGKLHIEGLGGSYGTERLTHYRMLPEMGPPETTSWEYPFPDQSWELELDEFIGAIAAGRQPSGNLEDALAALEIVGRIYGGA